MIWCMGNVEQLFYPHMELQTMCCCLKMALQRSCKLDACLWMKLYHFKVLHLNCGQFTLNIGLHHVCGLTLRTDAYIRGEPVQACSCCSKCAGVWGWMQWCEHLHFSWWFDYVAIKYWSYWLYIPLFQSVTVGFLNAAQHISLFNVHALYEKRE